MLSFSVELGRDALWVLLARTHPCIAPLHRVVPIPEAGCGSPQRRLGSCSLSPGFLGFVSVAGQGGEGGREVRHSYFLLCPVPGRSKASLPGPTSSQSSSRLMSKFIFLMS